MHVLLTGTSGFVGGHVLEEILTKTDWHVTCVNSFAHNGTMERFLSSIGMRDDTHSRVRALTSDLTIPFSISQRAFIGEVDYIVNIASMSQVDASISDPRAFIQNNVNLMLTMLDLARGLSVKRFIHFSTDEVYGPSVPNVSTDHRPSSPYAASKAAQEDISRAYARTYEIPLTIVNSANMFGERQSQLAFIPRVVRWIRSGLVVPIHFHGSKPGGRHYTYVRNVASHIVQFIDDDAYHVSAIYAAPARLLLSGQEYVANDALVAQVAQIMGCELELKWEVVQGGDVRPGYDPSYSLLMGDDWHPLVDFDMGLTTTVKWLEAQ